MTDQSREAEPGLGKALLGLLAATIAFVMASAGIGIVIYLCVTPYRETQLFFRIGAVLVALVLILIPTFWLYSLLVAPPVAAKHPVETGD